MARKDCFFAYHPVIGFLYFFLIMAGGLVILHPVCLVSLLLCGALYTWYLKGRVALRFGLIFVLPTLLLTALMNPLFNHQGVTVLTYFPGGNPLTLESILYGVGTALLLSAMLCWFSAFHVVMTTDKFVYLFGRVAPALSLLLSMTLRFVPRFGAQFRLVTQMQTAHGRGLGEGSLLQRGRNALTILSIVLTWALENGIHTADSMKSRGYGLPGRSAFAIYRWSKRDSVLLGTLLLAASYVIIAYATGVLSFRYYPSLKLAPITGYSISVFVVHLLFCALPMLLDLCERYAPHQRASKRRALT